MTRMRSKFGGRWPWASVAGSLGASLVAVELPDDDVVPRTNVQWLVHYNAIAAVSPKLNVNGAEARYWPE
jgi:hypothetical protein